MFSKQRTGTSTGNYSEQIQKLKSEIEQAGAILIGAGAGLSTAAGMAYDGQRYEKTFTPLARWKNIGPGGAGRS